MSPAGISISRTFYHIDERLMILSKEYNIPMKELWKRFNESNKMTIHHYQYVLRDLENQIQIEQAKK